MSAGTDAVDQLASWSRHFDDGGSPYDEFRRLIADDRFGWLEIRAIADALAAYCDNPREIADHMPLVDFDDDDD